MAGKVVGWAPPTKSLAVKWWAMSTLQDYADLGEKVADILDNAGRSRRLDHEPNDLEHGLEMGYQGD